MGALWWRFDWISQVFHKSYFQKWTSDRHNGKYLKLCTDTQRSDALIRQLCRRAICIKIKI